MASAGQSAVQPSPARREQILEAALSLFSEHGVHAVTTRQIAAAVGISQPSLYAFFATRQALVAEVSRRAFSALAARMSEELERSSGADLLQRLARAYIDFGMNQPDAYRIAFMMEGVRREAGGSPDAALGAGLGAFRIFRDTVADNLPRDVSPEAIDVAAQSTWASLHGLVSLMIARPNFPWADRETLVEAHIQRLFPG